MNEAPRSSSLSRRGFVGLGAAAMAGSAIGCDIARTEPRSTASGGANGVSAFELDGIGLAELQAGLGSGKWTARSLTQLYLGRIDEIDRRGPTLRSIIETNPDALDIADRLDEERRSGTVRGPLHGIPIVVKDNVATADRMMSTAGSLALAGIAVPADAIIAKRLRDAGAILLGKANLSEWANFRSSRSSSGWSARGGQCRNPYVLDRNPCGSSSGSGAAVSASLCAAAIGTETDGSIVCPSSANGVVGIKPTIGLVSRTGIIPISHNQDTAGPMARTVRDAAILLGALTGVDPADPPTANSTDHIVADWTMYLDETALSGARIGVARDYFGFHADVDTVMEKAIEALSGRGAVIVDPIRFQHRDELGDAEFTVLLYDFKADLNAYLAGLGSTSSMKTIADLIAFNEQNRDREMQWFGQEIFVQAQAKGALTDPEYRDALATCHRLARGEGIDAAFRKDRLDAIIAPTGGPAWTTDLVNGDHYSGGSSTLAAVAGYPAITVPGGDVHGLPIGLTFFGPAWSEGRLLGLAYSFEQATKHRMAPTFRPTLDSPPAPATA
jgi:amidase